MKKRCLSLLLACSLVFSFMPAAAIAEGTEEILSSRSVTVDSSLSTEASDAVGSDAATHNETAIDNPAATNNSSAHEKAKGAQGDAPGDTAANQATDGSTKNASSSQTNDAEGSNATDTASSESATQKESLDTTAQVESDDQGAVVPLAAGVLATTQETSNASISLGFREKKAPFLDEIDTTNNMWLTWRNGPENLSDYTYKLTDPSGTEVSLDNKKEVGTKKDSLLWSIPQSQLKEGTWTLTATKNGGESDAITATLTMRKVTFHAGSKGTFSGQSDSNTYVGYCCTDSSDAYFAFFNIPTVTVSEEGSSLIGWSTQSGDNNSEGILNWGVKASDFSNTNTLDLYAVYGEKKINSFSFTEVTDGGSKEIRNGDTIDLGEVDPGYSDDVASKKFKFTNTGNQSVDFAFIAQNNSNFELKTTDGQELKNVHLDTENNKELEFTIQPKKGLSTGIYTGTIQFRYNSTIYTYTLNLRVTSAKYLITVEDNIEKTYGEVWTQNNIIDKITAKSDKAGAQGNADYKSLGLRLNNPGFASTAEVNDDGYTYSLTNSTIVGVEAELRGTPKLKVVPAEIKEFTVSPSTAHIGQQLKDVTLSGTFKHNGVEIVGDLTWDPEDQEKTMETSGTLDNVKWIFTPSSKNYKPLSGTTSVTFSDLEESTLTVSADAQTTLAYDGKTHPITFTCNRDGDIKVQYRPANQDPEAAWSSSAPKDAGTYEVQASVERSGVYGSATQTTMLTIEPLEAKFSYEASSKQYDGNTSANNPRVWVTNKIGSDDVTATYTAEFDSKDAGTNRIVIFTITGLSGTASANYKLPAKTEYHYNSVIGKRNVSITGDLTKTYGQNLEGLDLDELNASQETEALKVDGLVGDDSVSDLGLVFSCDGFASEAQAGQTYPITAMLNTTNYQFSSVGGSAEVGKLTVNKATPVLRSEVTVGLARKNCELDHVALSGEFVNPNNSDMVVKGTFGWKNPDTTLPNADTYDADWVFTLDPSAVTNYEQPEGGKVTITLIDQEPFPLSAEAQAASYTASPQAYTNYTAETSEGEKPAQVDISYKKHSDLATVRLLSLDEVGDDWTSEQPVDAGTYDVRITATPESGSEYAANSIETLFTITPIAPTFEASQTVEVPEGTALSDVSVAEKLTKPCGIDGKPLDGVFTWSTPDAVVSDDDETYNWTFTPASSNYTGVSGTATFTLAPDERAITATVYNLPNSLGLQDYAVVDVKASGLKLGDVVTLFTYNEDGSINPESEPTPVVEADLDDGALNVALDGDALDVSGGTIYARITSSKKNNPATLEYGPEPQLSLLADGLPLDNNLISILMGESSQVSVAGLDGLVGYEVLDVSYDAMAKTGAATCTQNAQAATVTVDAAGTDGELKVTVKLKHPDPAKAGEDIVFTLTARILGHGGVEEKLDNDEVLSGGLAINGPSLVDAVLSGDEIDQAFSEGYVVDVLLAVKAVDESQVDSADKSKTEAALEANDYTLGQYMDIDLTKIKKSSITEQEETPIYETKGPVGITVSVPETLQQELLDKGEGIRFKDFDVLRVHNGETTILSDLDNDPATVTFESDKFSTYALIYRDSSERGSLNISNEVFGNKADPNQEFNYTLTVDYGEDTITGIYGELEFKDGTATFTLKGGQSVSVGNLPAGGTYTITQQANSDYATQQSGASGTIMTGETIEATFINQRDIFDITFDANGGTVNGAEKLTLQTQPDGTLGTLPQAVREGYVFNGWFSAAEGGTKVVDGASFSTNTSLFAHWSKATAQTPASESDSSNSGSSSSSPDTGDNSILPLCLVLAAISAFAIVGAAVLLRRRNKSRIM